MSATTLRRLLAVVLLLLLLAAVAYWFYQRDTGTSADTLQVYGNVDVREVDLAFNNSEHIATLLVEEGDAVKKGQLLATLHRERLDASLAAARAG
ncbi:MAG: biotin/lipoyl-binding protein, partial [Thiogranum sp.]